MKLHRGRKGACKMWDLCALFIDIVSMKEFHVPTYNFDLIPLQSNYVFQLTTVTSLFDTSESVSKI